jgi:hypothetical protein
MKPSICGGALAALVYLTAAASAEAATITFDFTSTSPNLQTASGDTDGDGDTAIDWRTFRSFESAGYSLTARGWGLTNDVSGPDSYETAFLGRYTSSAGGLGVTNRDESGGDNNHTVDNEDVDSDFAGDVDVVSFEFGLGSFVATSVTIHLNFFDLNAFPGDQTDGDFQARFGFLSAPINLAGITYGELSALPMTTASFDGPGDPTPPTYSFTVQNFSGNAMFILPAPDGNNDGFKIKGMTFTGDVPPPPSEVPEPASMAVAAVGAMGLFASRRRA